MRYEARLWPFPVPYHLAMRRLAGWCFTGWCLAAWCLTAWCFVVSTTGAAPLSVVPPSLAVTTGAPAQVRLVPAGHDSTSGRYRAVVEIALADGYKTYWREPGDSGVPTQFAWTGSDNVADVSVRYPTPVRFFDGIGYAIGYLRTVRFPLEVTPIAGDRPVELRLDIDFGVCREICIPEQATVDATLSDVVPVAGVWEDVTALLPVATPRGAAIAGLGVESARLAADTLHVTVTGDIGDDGDVFVEGPAGWYFGRPERELRPGGGVFTVPVRHPSFSVPVELSVTVAGNGRSIETQLRLDPPG